MLVDLLTKIEDNKSFVLNYFTINDNNKKWDDIVLNMLSTWDYYTHSGKRVFRYDRKTNLISTEVITQDIIDSVISQLPLLKIQSYTARINSIKSIIGNDYRDDIYKIDTHPWSPYELKNFLVIRFDLTEEQLNQVHSDSYIYWKTELGLSAQEISDIEDIDTVWNPKYTDEFGFLKIQNTYTHS